MFLVYSKQDKESLDLADKVVSQFRKHNQAVSSVLDFGSKSLKDASCIVVIGDDNTMLEVVRKLDGNQIPVFGIATRHGFLFQTDASTFMQYLPLLVKKKYSVSNKSRIDVLSNGRVIDSALNDVGIFPSKSASLMSYQLNVGGSQLWKDTADGIIIATPTGSTGYSFSAFGPVIVGDPSVFSISPISSTEKRSPAVVSDTSEIEVMNIVAQQPVIIIDGDIRISLKGEKVVVRKSKHDALFVQFSEELSIDKKLKKKSSFSVSSVKLAPSARLVYKVLSYEGEMTQKELIINSNLPERTVRHALDVLLQKKLITMRPHLTDARQTVYGVG